MRRNHSRNFTEVDVEDEFETFQCVSYSGKVVVPTADNNDPQMKYLFEVV